VMANHVLKLADPWWDRVKSGEKTAEIRRHDRDFQTGDTITFLHVPAGDAVAASDGPRETMQATITHVLPGMLTHGIADDYCILSIKIEEGE
jgi:ASCH domain.